MGETNPDTELKSKKLELLNDHYKDSFCDVEEYQKKRDWFFLYIIAIMTILLFQINSPKEAQDIISEFIKKKLELDKQNIDLSFIGSLIWFALLGTSLKYFQTQVLIERMYKYVHNLEDLLSSEYDGKAFSREGKSYLQNYPLYSSFVTRIYTVVFPLLIILIPLAAISQEWFTQGLTIYFVTNFIFFSLTLILTILYWRYLNLMRSSYLSSNPQHQAEKASSNDQKTLSQREPTQPALPQEQITLVEPTKDSTQAPQNLEENEQLKAPLAKKQHGTFE